MTTTSRAYIRPNRQSGTRHRISCTTAGKRPVVSSFYKLGERMTPSNSMIAPTF